MDPLDALRRACEARPAEEADAVDGVRPAYVASPASPDEARDVMRAAAEHRLAVVPRGGGSKLAWGVAPRGCDLVVDTRRLDRILEHAAGDLVCRVEAGLPMRRLTEALAPAGQQLALDVPVPGSTVGGVLATAVSGPRRLLYGTARDLLIGITVVRADGTVARSGGKVVKNVAGYDLGKLYTGSYGTLGLIVEAVFRLHPVPEARAYVTTQAEGPSPAYDLVRAVLRSQLAPTAVEVDRPEVGAPVTLGVLVEGVASAVSDRTDAAARLLGAGSRTTATPPSWWGLHPQGPTLIKVASPIGALPHVLGALDGAASDAGVPACVRGSAGTGVLHVGLGATDTPAAAAAYVEMVRRAVARHGGTVLVLRAPREIRAATDPWGPVKGLTLMRRVKDQFDPEHRLAPGRFVGGI